MFSPRDESAILSELQDFSRLSVSKYEGTFEYDVFSANAIEFAKTEVELAQMILAVFPHTSWGRYLTLGASAHGIDRKLAVESQGEVVIKGSVGTTIARGSQFSTDDNTVFVTRQDYTIGSTGAVTAVIYAQNAGVVGNVAEGAIKNIPLSIPGVASVNNAAATHDGYDEESDESLLNRLLLHVRNPGTSGNSSHYREWSLAVPGVGAVKVQPLWNGNGTVRVLILDVNKDAASESLIKQVSEYIEVRRPIGATVTVVAPMIQSINIEVSVKPVSDKSEYKTVLYNAVNRYFTDVGFDSDNISIAQVGKALLSTGVIDDYESLTINSAIKNISINADSIPRIGNFEVTTIA